MRDAIEHAIQFFGLNAGRTVFTADAAHNFSGLCHSEGTFFATVEPLVFDIELLRNAQGDTLRGARSLLP